MSKWHHQQLFCQGTKKINNSIVVMVTDLWCHLTHNSRGAWHTVYAMLLSNCKWDAIWISYSWRVRFSQTCNCFSNNLSHCYTLYSVCRINLEKYITDDEGVWAGWHIFAIFTKRNKFCDFLFVSLGDDTFPKRGLLLREQILSLKSWPFMKGR